MGDQTLSEELNTSKTRRSVNYKIIRDYLKFYTPTDRDVNYQPNTNDLKELCRRLPCRVLMFRWNPVHDYLEQFRKEGRLKKKSIRHIQKLVTKAVNRHKTHALYTDQEIRAVRELEWRQGKKDNLLRLSLWKYDSGQMRKPAQMEIFDIEELIEEIDEDDFVESVNAELQLVNRQLVKRGRETVRRISGVEPSSVQDHVTADDNYDADIDGNDNHSQELHMIGPSAEKVIVAARSNAAPTIQADDLEAVLMHTYVDLQQNSSLVSATVEIQAKDGAKQNSSSQQSAVSSVDNQIVNEYMNLNTESMPLSTQSMQQCSAGSVASFDSIVPLYEDFTEYPLTSTQSQPTSSQEAV